MSSAATGRPGAARSASTAVFQVLNDAGRRVRREQRRVVLEREIEARLRLVEIERQVEAADVLAHRERPHRDPVEAEVRRVAVLQHDHHVEKRRAAEVALESQFVHQAVEWIALVIERSAHRVAAPPEQRRKRLATPHAKAQRKRVGVEADLRRQVRMRAPFDGRSDRDVLLAGETAEQQVHRPEHTGEEACAVGAGQLAEPRESRGVQPTSHHTAIEGLHRGTPGIERKGERLGPIGECAVPERARGARGRPVEIAPLPGGVVLVLNGQRIEIGRLPARHGGIEGRQLAHEDGHRCAVRDQVMHHHEQAEARAPEPAHLHAQERRLLQVERLARPPDDRAREGVARVASRGPVLVIDDKADRVDHFLTRLAVAADEARAQRLVPRHQSPERLLERRHVQIAVDEERARHVVGGEGRRRHLLQHPQTPLAVRQRIAVGTVDGHQRFDRARSPVTEEPGQRADGLVGEEIAEAEIERELLRRPSDDPRRLQTVAAEVEEVVVESHLLDVEHLFPQPGERPLRLRARREVLGAQGDLRRAGPQQRRTIDLSARRPGQLVEQRVARRNHVVRQRRLEQRPQGGRVRRLVPRHDERAQLRRAGSTVAEDDNGI